MDAREIIHRYKGGVSFACGCEERDLHPAIEKALLTGRLDPLEMTRCAVHREPMLPGNVLGPAVLGQEPGESLVLT